MTLDETAIPLEDGRKPAGLRRVEVEPEARADLEPLVEELREECRLEPAASSKYEAALFVRGPESSRLPELGPTGANLGRAVGGVAFAVMR